jgi:hypothetical protein
MTLLRGAQACEFCDGTTRVRVCSGQRSNGELCPNQMCVQHSYIGPKGLVCPECKATSQADLDHRTGVPSGHTRIGELLMACEHTVGVITAEDDRLTINVVPPPSQPPR